MRYIFLTLLVFVLIIDNAYAYVGPGLGLGAIGAVVGLIVAIILSIVGVIWYPFKRMLRKLKSTKVETNNKSN